MPKRLRRNVGKFFKTRREFFKKNLSIFRLLLTKFESTKNTKKGQPILGQDKTVLNRKSYGNICIFLVSIYNRYSIINYLYFELYQYF